MTAAKTPAKPKAKAPADALTGLAQLARCNCAMGDLPAHPECPKCEGYGLIQLDKVSMTWGTARVGPREPTAFELQRDELDRALKRINAAVPKSFEGGDARDYIESLQADLREASSIIRGLGASEASRGTPLPDCRICGELWAHHSWSGDALRCRAGGGEYALARGAQRPTEGE